MKTINKQFLVLTIALILSFSSMTVCRASEISANDKASAGTERQNSATDNKPNADNKAPENKSAKSKQTKSIEIFDGRDGEVKNTKPSEAETALIEKEVRLRAKEKFLKKRLGVLGENVDWNEEFTVDGVVEGSFTKANSKQKAFLYRYSYTNGVVIVENEITVAHYSGDPGDYALYFCIKSLPDINKDGLAEIILFRNVEDNEDIYAYLFEFKKGVMNFLGEVDFFSSNYQAGGDVESEKAEKTTYKVTVKPSANPTYFRETYKKAGSGKWSPAKNSEKFSLNKDIDAKLTKID